MQPEIQPILNTARLEWEARVLTADLAYPIIARLSDELSMKKIDDVF